MTGCAEAIAGRAGKPPRAGDLNLSWAFAARVNAACLPDESRQRWLTGKNDTAMESAIKTMIIHSKTSIRLVPDRSDILP